MEIWKTNRRIIRMESPPTNSYLEKAYGLALNWLDGRDEFTLHTSGSTGIPKPIQLKRRQMAASAHMTGMALELPKGTRVLVCLHVQYIAGFMMLVRGMELDWELTVIEPVRNPLLSFDSTVRFDFVSLVPMQLQSCLDNPGTRSLIEQCEKILLGGAPVSVALEREIQALRIPVYQSYGMTETVSHVALRRLNTRNRQKDYQVLDGVNFGVDSRQCLYVEGEVTDFQLVQTNDLVEITSDRSFQWIGRADAVINSGGLKIHLDTMDRKVEEVLLELGISENYFSWYKEDAILGQKLVLFLETKPVPELKKKVIEHLSIKVKAHEVPKAVYFVEKFARTPTEKLDKMKTATTYYTLLT